MCAFVLEITHPAPLITRLLFLANAFITPRYELGPLGSEGSAGLERFTAEQ